MKERQLIASGLIEGMASDLVSLRNTGFRLLFGTGAPVPLDVLSVETGYRIDQLESILKRPDVAGRVRRNECGELIGIAGLSIEPTPHEVQMDAKRFWTLCALDAVGIISALGSTGRVVSTTPGQSNPLRIDFVDGQAVSDQTIFIPGEYDGTDVCESWCPNVNFFATAEDAKAWASERGLTGEVVTIDQVSDAARAIWESVVEGIDIGYTD